MPTAMKRFLTVSTLIALGGAAAHADSGKKISCKEGVNIAGDVNFAGGAGPDVPNPAGQKLFADPPVPFWRITFLGNTLHASTLNELWTADLGKDGKFVRYAGVDPLSEKREYKWKDGPCADARLPQINGIVAAPDGSLFTTDTMGQGIMHITSPGKPDCKVDFYAGNMKVDLSLGAFGLPYGDKEGPAKVAAFRHPESPVVDSAGNLYVLDNYSKIKKIGTDPDHTVTTIATLPLSGSDEYPRMTLMGGKFYVVHIESLYNAIVEVDLATGKTREVIKGETGDKKFAPMDTATLPTFSAMTNDGSRVILFGKGYLWSLAPDGKIDFVGGTRAQLLYPAGYDPAKPHKAGELILPGDFRNVDLLWKDGDLYFHGSTGGMNNSFLTKISCK
jgi:hypothetical protein